MSFCPNQNDRKSARWTMNVRPRTGDSLAARGTSVRFSRAESRAFGLDRSDSCTRRSRRDARVATQISAPDMRFDRANRAVCFSRHLKHTLSRCEVRSRLRLFLSLSRHAVFDNRIHPSSHTEGVRRVRVLVPPQSKWDYHQCWESISQTQ